jgi:tRNA (guanosine-2'-O-)-methyltransferase
MSIRTRIKEIKHLRNKHLICVLEEPKLAVNLAGTIRNVSALGVEKVYIIGGYPGAPKTFEQSRNNQNLATGSVGSNKWTFIKHFSTPEECVNHLRKKLYTVAVTSPYLKGRKNVELYNGNFTQKRLAVWFGNESHGISDFAAQNADLCIQIPMGGIVESLNLATSTGIVLSYIRHQRLKVIQENAAKKIKTKTIIC